MREPLCICWASLTSGIVVRAAVPVVTEGEGAAEGAGALEPVIPVPAPVFVAVTGVVVVVGGVVGAAGLLTLLPISKDAKEKKR
jgi:hypothetical protein